MARSSRTGSTSKTPRAEVASHWPLTLGEQGLSALIEAYGSPLYIYSADVLRRRCQALREAFPEAHVHYAMKANSNPALLDLVRKQGLGVDTVSAWEVRLARSVGFRKRDIVYSGNNPTDDELRTVHKQGVVINVDALSAIERLARIAPGARVALRLNLEIGGGHHKHVVTAGPDSKFGLGRDEITKARTLAAERGLRVVGVHQHIGSGIYELDLFLRAMEPLLDVALEFPDLEFVDAGGGFGVPYRPDDAPIDLPAWGAAITQRFKAFRRKHKSKPSLLLEPGRYVVAESGALLTTVTTIKRTRDRTFVGVDSGMHHLVRPAMYGSYHEVRTVPSREGNAERCFVVGPICESGDVLAEERSMIAPMEGDRLVLMTAGAYGYSMSSHYNLRARPAELLIDGDRVECIRKRERYRDVVRQ